MPHLLLALTLTAVAAAPDPWPKGIEFDRIDGSSVHFKAPEGTSTPKPLDTKLSDLKHLGTIESSDGSPPYLLFSGRACQGCDLDRHVYAFRADGGKSTHFVYPGKVLDPKSGGVVLESRAFFGKCLSTMREAYVVFQRERVDRRGMQSSVFVAEPAKDHMSERLIERRMPSVKTALQQVKRKQCTEIEGRKRLMHAKPLDLRPRRNIEEDEDEDDEPLKENQTDEDLKSESEPEA
jgi:hypothetical protein